MTTPTILNGEEYFFPIIYEGNGAGQKVGKFVPFTDNGTIDNSVIFNDGDSAYLDRTFGSGNQKIWTMSFWVKRCKLGTGQRIISRRTGGGSTTATMGFRVTTNQFDFYDPSNGGELITNRSFEDTSKWYHFLIRYEASNDTQADRIQIYVDGERQTFTTSVAISDANGNFNAAVTHAIGKYQYNNTEYLDGYLAEVNWIDGQALEPASFGVTDTSTGRWIPKTVSPYPTTTTDIAVTVVDSGGNKYALDGVTQDTVTLIEGATYKFDQSDSSNSGHPLRFSTTSDGTHGGGSEYTTGVTTVGTPGSAGAYTEITVATGAPTLYYYCTNHSGMGGTANTQDQYGTNGFRLTFSDNSTASALGTDSSGNSNTFSVNGIDTVDQTTDSPTQNSNTFGSISSGVTLSEGNLTVNSGSSGSYIQAVGQPAFGVRSGKWYWEVKVTTVGAAVYGWKDDGATGGSQANDGGSSASGGLSTGGAGSFSAGSWFIDLDYNNEVNYTTVSTNDVLMFAMDLDSGKGYCGKNGTWFNSANPANGTGAIGGCHRANGINKFYPCVNRLDSASVGEFNFGQRSFAHTPPTGFSALQQDNLPETAKGISGLVWTKNRDAADDNQLYDSSRGKQLVLTSNATNVESTVTDGLQKFLAGGQQIEDSDAINTAGESFVTWNWVANGGTTSTNTEGSITSTVQANTTAGFSICRWTAPSTAGKFGHGLSQAPEWIIGKDLGRTTGWFVYHKDVGTGKLFYLNSTAAPVTNSTVYSTAPTATVVDPGTGLTSGSSYGEQVYYCWHSVDGFSKFGSFTGNGNANGPFIYTGFKPRWLMWKRTNSTNQWVIHDSTRNSVNPVNQSLYANITTVGETAIITDFLSNGFKLRSGTNGNANTSGSTYVYIAFAEHPFNGDGTNPVTAQ